MRWILKYGIDFVIAILLLVLLCPFFLMIGLGIWLNDRGTVLYKQPRLGKDSKVFLMYKFRSMQMNAPDIRCEDGATFNAENDPRVTSVGKFLRKTSLDELPQVINVLKGEMSFIGPRPDLPDQIELYEDEDKKRLLVRPGITGYAQVMGRNQLGFRERFKYDLQYIEDYNLGFDLKITLMTLMVILKRDRVHRC